MQIRSLARIAMSAACLILGAGLSAQNLGDFFVDGKTGQDVPSAGRSASSPWKTIGYAHTQIPDVNPQTQGDRWYTLFVEGDQVYSPSTNGETLPIVPKSTTCGSKARSSATANCR